MKNTLTVSINSFSYKRAIPVDPSENGGGFVFDCRAIHNPGRYEELKKFTGKNKEIIHFFENEPEMDQFLEHVFALVSQSVKKYISRGFTSLMVSFGCTGGQHRSVYCAEKLASFLNLNFDVAIKLNHIEQEILKENKK